LIGRDAVTIRAFREMTRVELIIDDSSDQVYLTAEDGDRVQAARRVLVTMISERQFTREKIREYAGGGLSDENVGGY